MEKILNRIKKQKDCLIWTGGLHPQGYPMARIDNKMYLVSRYMMEEHIGYKLKKQQRVKNRCGNKLCVNPEHYIIAEPGTEEWKCVNFRYPPEEVEQWMRQVFDKDGKRVRGKATKVYEKVKQTYPKLTTATFWVYMKKYENKLLTSASK